MKIHHRMFYFGLKFLYAEVDCCHERDVGDAVLLCDLLKMPAVVCLTKLIRTDVDHLNHGKFNERGVPTEWTFEKEQFALIKDKTENGRKCVWVYIHSRSIAASHCTYHNFTQCVSVKQVNWDCTDNCSGHPFGHQLWAPFFYDNKALADIYLHQNKDRIPGRLVPLFARQKDTFCEHSYGGSYDENTWTRRFARVLETCLKPRYTVDYTAPEGTSFPAHQHIKCGLPADYVNTYPFKGTPDICVEKGFAVTEGLSKKKKHFVYIVFGLHS